MHTRGYHVFPSKVFCLTVPINLVGEPFCAVFQKSSGSKNFMDKRRGGLSRFSIEIFLSHSAEKFRRGIFQCFTNFWSRKNLDKRRGGCIKIFRRKFFVSVPKIFVGESFTVAIISGIEKVWIRGGGNHDFPSVLSHCIEIFHWRTLWCFRKILSSKIFMHRRGHHGFVENFLSHSADKFARWTLLCCVSEIFR